MATIPPTNLPLQLTSFIGREREMAEVKRLLSSSRLLTLTGPGGSGKTRLSLQVAADLLDVFSDGVWVIELASLADPNLVPRLVASEFKVREWPDIPLVETLVDYLRAKQLLLVLDNCEHLVQACAEFAERLLRACPRVKILATSREALAIGGEATFRVPALTVPDPRKLPPLESLARFEAIGLFVERATAVKHDFRLTHDNASSIAQICRRLDGMPLAIELAATRTKTLTTEQIAARLDDRFRLLTLGHRTALPRQQTLQAAIDWSYNLLSPEEQMLLRRLSVFAGGWTLPAAETVVKKDWSTSLNVLDVLTRLVDKSLVLVEEHHGEARYGMLETIREYAHARLAESGELATVQNLHLAYFTLWVEKSEPELVGPQQMAWLNRTELEYDNLRATLSWSIENDVESGLRLAAALREFWYLHNYWSEGRSWLREILQRDALVSPSVRAKALAAAGYLASFQNDYSEAISLSEASLALYRALGDKRGMAFSLFTLGMALGDMGDLTRSTDVMEQSLALRRHVGDKDDIAYSLHVLGENAILEGDYARANALLEESLALFREQGDSWAIALSLLSLGETGVKQGDYSRAEPLLNESANLFRQAGDNRGLGISLQESGLVAQTQGNLETAFSLCREGLVSFYRVGDKWSIARCIEAMAGIALAQEKTAQAVTWWGAADALRQTIHSPLPPADRAPYEQNLQNASTQLGEKAFQEAWEAGQVLTCEQAVESALTLGAAPLEISNPQGSAFASKPQPELRVSSLGTARVYRSDHEIASSEWTYTKARELFYYLLSNSPRTKEQIGLALWPDASSAQLRSNLKVTLYHLRRALGRADWILFESDQYSFNRALNYWFDVEEFESIVAEAKRLRVKKPVEAAALLRQAISLYNGDFMSDWSEGEWYLERQRSLQQEYLEALMTLGQLEFTQGQYAHAAQMYQKALSIDSYLEAAHRELMRSLVRQGERGQALRHYQEMSSLLREQVGAPPAAESRALYERLQRGEEI